MPDHFEGDPVSPAYGSFHAPVALDVHEPEVTRDA